MTETLHYVWTWDLPASPARLWPLVSDTDRFDQDAGLPPVRDARTEGEALDGARRRLSLRVLGVPVRWEEQPFEWVRPHRYGVVRRYDQGPLKAMRVRVELEPLGEGTRLRYEVWAEPSGLLGTVAARVQIGILSRRAFGRAFREYGRRPAEGGYDGEAGRPRAGGALEARLAEAGASPAAAARVAAHVESAADVALSRIRPYELADAWGLPRRQVLEACLRGTRAGVLELRWDVLCPLCRGAKETAPSLRELRVRGVHCDTCQVDFAAEFDRSIELSFRPSPAVRAYREASFCVAGPRVTPHVVVQGRIPPGGELTARPELEVAAAPELTVRNRTAHDILVVVERTSWSDGAVTAADVTRLGTFRDLYSSEVLSAGEFLGVRGVTILFTDLAASTRLYRTIGDGPAFGRVMHHFEVLERVVEDHDGVVVKTIGDAVMAAFAAPVDGVRAGLAAHRRLAETPATADLGLKAALHLGPCLVVTSNGRLDYFGTAVNIAARLGEEARPGDLVVSDAVRGADGVREGVPALAAAQRLDLTARGMEDEPLVAWRLPARPPEIAP